MNCLSCSNKILYPNTKLNKLGDPISGSSYKTIKTINGKIYNLLYCYDCLCKFIPSVLKKNSSKLFNTLNLISKFAFDINDIDYEDYNKSRAVTLENLCRKYGEVEGKLKFESYRNKQSISNTLEYKLNKGWTELEFLEYNKSRAVTLENLCRKYGEVEGKLKFESYRNKQKINGCSLDWFISIHGEIEGLAKYKNVNKRKALTLENFKLKYGEVEGLSKFENFISKSVSYSSKISQEFCDLLDIHLTKYTTYYSNKNGEFGVNLITKYIKLDYYIKELNLAIEFYGDYWHANPKYYNFDSLVPPTNKLASSIWNNDIERITKLKELNITTLIVWENDFRNNRNNCILNLLDKIKKYELSI